MTDRTGHRRKLLGMKDHLLGLVDSIVRMEHTPFPFLCAASMIDNLVNITGYRNNYSGFVRKFFPEEYKEFTYKNKKTDLPEQMEYVLRNGLVHNFSLVPRRTPRIMAKCLTTGCGYTALVFPSDVADKGGPPHCPMGHGPMTVGTTPSIGRARSILITHRSEREGPHLRHITRLPDGKKADAALFVLEDFCYDLAGVIRAIFDEAEADRGIQDKLSSYPIAQWLGTLSDARSTQSRASTYRGIARLARRPTPANIRTLLRVAAATGRRLAVEFVPLDKK